MKTGESYLGYTISMENGMAPLIFYRRGLTDRWDLGLRLGMFLSGTGVDISRVLAHNENRTDVLNLAYSINPNYNIDYTYYRILHKTKINTKKSTVKRKLSYVGLRGMIILNGIGGHRSNRFGILIGGAPAVKGDLESGLPKYHRYQWEVGFFHDFNSMPITAIFNPARFDHTADPRYADYPHTEGNYPSEYSRLTGISLRLSFPLRNPTIPVEQVVQQ